MCRSRDDRTSIDLLLNDPIVQLAMYADRVDKARLRRNLRWVLQEVALPGQGNRCASQGRSATRGCFEAT